MAKHLLCDFCGQAITGGLGFWEDDFTGKIECDECRFDREGFDGDDDDDEVLIG